MHRIALLALFLVLPANAQTISERVGDLERSIADMKAATIKTNHLEVKVDALTRKVDALTNTAKMPDACQCPSGHCSCPPELCNAGRCLAIGGTGAPAPGGTERADHYEWRVTPGGHYALMRNEVQIGNMIVNDGYYPKLPGDNRWGPKTQPPYPFTMPTRIAVPQYPPTGHAVQFGTYPAYAPAFRVANCGPRG